MPQRSPLFTHLQKTMIAAGEQAGAYFRKNITVKTKPDGSKVSLADYAVNEFLHDALLGYDEHIAWLSEESPEDPARLTAERIWIIDPIDGTHSFLNGEPDWTIVAALIERGEPILGAVYNPVNRELYMAEKSEGAWLNDEKITTSDQAELNAAHIIASKSQFNRVFEEGQPAPKRSWRCSMAYRIALVASGQAEATISLSPKNDWDIAAAHIILNEAGGTMTTQKGVDFRYNKPKLRHSGVVATNTPLYTPIIEKTSAAADKARKA